MKLFMKLSKTFAVVALGLSVAGPASALTCPENDLITMYEYSGKISDLGGKQVDSEYFGMAQFGDQNPQPCELSAGNTLDVEKYAPWAGEALMAFECQGKRIRRDIWGYEIQDSNGTWHKTIRVSEVDTRRVCKSLPNNIIRVTVPNSWGSYRIAGTDKTFAFGTGKDFFYQGKAVGSFGF